MAKSAFTEGLLSTLSNHHGAIPTMSVGTVGGTNKDVTGARLHIPTEQKVLTVFLTILY